MEEQRPQGGAPGEDDRSSQPPLGKQHNWWSTSSACPQTPTHGKQMGVVTSTCTTAKLWSHWDYTDLVGQLECCREGKVGLGRQGGVFGQEWLECIKLSLEQVLRQSLLMGKWSEAPNTGSIMVSICYWLLDQKEKVDEAFFRQLEEALQLQATVLIGGLNNSCVCLERQYGRVKLSRSFLMSTEQNQQKKEMKVQSHKKMDNTEQEHSFFSPALDPPPKVWKSQIPAFSPDSRVPQTPRI